MSQPIAHDHARLGAYALGVLDGDDARAVDLHVASCPDCRRDLVELVEMSSMLGEVPPEAFLDGPPDGGDLLLRRTLRQVRAEGARQAPSGRLRVALVAAAIVLFAGVGLGSGILIGRQNSSAPPSAGGPPASASGSTVPGTRALAGTDRSTGATLTGTVVPAAGWVRVHVTVGGVKAGVPCDLFVVSRTGQRVLAGSWLVSAAGERGGTPLDGTARIPPADVASIEVVTSANVTLISVPV
jgi:anti-sigma factor RsiW